MKKDRYYRSLNDYMKREEEKEMWKDAGYLFITIVLGIVVALGIMAIMPD